MEDKLVLFPVLFGEFEGVSSTSTSKERCVYGRFLVFWEALQDPAPISAALPGPVSVHNGGSDVMAVSSSSSSSSSSSLKTVSEHGETLTLLPCCTLLTLSVLFLSASFSRALLKYVAAFFFFRRSSISRLKEPKDFAVNNPSDR